MAINRPTIRLLLVSVLLSTLAVRSSVAHKKSHKHKVVSKLVYKFADAVPNNIAFMQLNKPRHFRVALMLYLAPKILYHRLARKYKKQHKKNERMRKKYRTIVPVSIIPQLAYMRAYNREKNSLYYIVGPDETVEPKPHGPHGPHHPKPTILAPEIPEETKEAYEKGSMLEQHANAKEATMVQNGFMTEHEIMGQASQLEAAAINQARVKNQQSIMDVENEIKEISTKNKIDHINYEDNGVRRVFY